MVADPYKVLGVSEGATQDEIKRAYRAKAKECHPDLHPNDPDAARRMNEVNEAYDMLINPDKYAKRRAQEQARQTYQQGYGNPYGQQGNPYGQQTYGGYGDFGDFGDFFGFGFGPGAGNVQMPTEQPGDDARIRLVIADIRAGRYQEAVTRLQDVPSTGRNARWYYLSALAHYGLGNQLQAIEQITRAVQMEPNNQTYQLLLRRYRQAGQTYSENGRGFDMRSFDPSKLCMLLCWLQFCCRCC